MRKAYFNKLTKLILVSAFLCVSLSGCLLSSALGTRLVYIDGDIGGFLDSESKESLAILMRDIRSFGVYTVSAYKSKTLDLNGHVLTCKQIFPIPSNPIFTVMGELTIKDSGNGGLIKNESNANYIINVTSSGKLILESCSFESDNFYINVSGELVLSEEMYNSISNKIVRERYGRITLTD